MFPDVVFLNGRIHTLNKDDEVCQAVAVLDGRVVATGTNSEINELCGPNTRMIDVKGLVGLPGFIDTHLHPATAGMILKYWIDCADMHSIQEIRLAVKQRATGLEKGKWIQGKGYDEFRLAESRVPAKWDLDDVAPDNPCAIWRGDGHVLTVNSFALSLAGISAKTIDPEGGKIYRNDLGEPSGVLAERAQTLVTKFIPKPTQEELKEGILVGQQTLAKWGVTSYDEALVTKEEFRAYQDLKREGRLKLRVGLLLAANFVDEPIAQDAIKAGLETGFGDDWLRVVGAKIIADGSMASSTAALSSPYPGTETTGVLIQRQEELESLVEKCISANLRPCIHAIGDRAVAIVIAIIEKLLQERVNLLADHRIRIEHCGMTTPEYLEKIRENHIAVSSSINFLYKLGDNHIRVLGDERLSGYYVGRSYLRKGIVAAGNSDWPVTPANPLHGIYSLVTRKTEGGNLIQENEKLTIIEAIRFYTTSAAFLDFVERTKGSLEVGRVADLVFLDKDIFNVDSEQIPQIQVLMTVVGGNVVSPPR